MATFDTKRTRTAWGRQTAEGSALAGPKFEIPLRSGDMDPGKVIENLPYTQDSQDNIGQFVPSQNPGLSLTVPATIQAFPSLAYSAMGALATTGASAPYSHAATFANSLPWYTWWFKGPEGIYWKLTDAKTDTFEVAYSAGQPLDVNLSVLAKSCTPLDAAWSTATVEESATAATLLSMNGASLKLEHSTTPATTEFHESSSGSFSISRNIDARQTDEITRHVLAEQSREIVANIEDAALQDVTWLRAIYTGTDSGTTMSNSPQEGSLEWTFLCMDGTAAATKSAVIAAPRASWMVSTLAGGSGDGGTATYGFTAAILKPTSGETVTITTKNAYAGVAY